MVAHQRGSFVRSGSRILQVIGVIALAAYAGAAAADEVTAKGTVLHGKVTGLSGAGITFEPEYGKGSLAIKWADIENIKTDRAFQVLYGDDESDAPLQGFSNGVLQVGATAVDVKTLHQGVPIGAAGPSFGDRMRSFWRYWDGNLDAAVNVQQATTDTTGFLLNFNTVRTKDPTKLTLGAAYRYSTEKKSGQQSSTIQDQAAGLVRGDYYFTPRIYGFGSGDATYDAIQRLSLRAVPKLGAGYVIWEDKLEEDKRNFLQAEVGGAYVYERYFEHLPVTTPPTPPDPNNPSNLTMPRDRDYFAVAFGALAGYYLPYGAHADWRVDYLPAVNDFTGQYLLRNDFGLTLPLIDPISAKFSLLDEYNNQPAQGSKHNSLYLAFGLSVGW